MKLLSMTEIDEVNGGFMPFLIGTLIGLGSYVYGNVSEKELMSYQGAAVAAGFGGATGGLSGAAVGAAGGGIVANVVWRPGFMAINGAGQLIAAEQ